MAPFLRIGVLVLLALDSFALAAPVEYQVETAASTLKYTVSHPFKYVVGVSKEASGKGMYDPAEGGTVRVAAPVKGFKSGNANRDVHMLEVVFAHRNPEVAFEAKLPPNLPADGKATVDGTVTLKGVSKPVKVELELKKRAGGGVVVKATFVAKMTEHQIERPTLMFIAVADEIRVEAEVAFSPAKRDGG